MREDGHELGVVLAHQVNQAVVGDHDAAGRHQAAALAQAIPQHPLAKLEVSNEGRACESAELSLRRRDRGCREGREARAVLAVRADPPSGARVLEDRPTRRVKGGKSAAPLQFVLQPVLQGATQGARLSLG
jgi:hypothetical protein